MSTHDEVLDAIDQTLHDYEVSDDAMRWSPEPPPRRDLGKGDRFCQPCKAEWSRAYKKRGSA